MPGSRGASSSRRPTPAIDVAVALEHLIVAQEVDRQCEEDQPEHEPVGLVARQAVIDPVDHHQAYRGQQRDQREQVGIGVGETDPQIDMA